VVAAMNALGYDALAMSNHEFDAGHASLDSAAARARFPFPGPTWWTRARATRLRRRWCAVQGVRISIIGLTTPAVPQLMDSSLYRGAVPGSAGGGTSGSLLRGPERRAVIALVPQDSSGTRRHAAATSHASVTREREPGLGWPTRSRARRGHPRPRTRSSSVMVGGALVTQAGKRG
jgi:hypothetical protein